MGKLTNKIAGLCVGCALIITPLTASAAGNKDQLQNQKQSIVQQKGDIQAEIHSFNSKIKDLTGEISNTQIKIGQTKDKVNKLNNEIEETQARISNRQDLLKDRLNAVYKNGGASSSYLEILLSSKDFGDLINRATALYTINKSDQDLIDKQKKDYDKLAAKKAEVESDLKENQERLDELKGLIAKAEDIQNEKEAKLASLDGKLDNIDSELAQLARDAAEKRAKAEAAKSTEKAVTTDSSTSNNDDSDNTGSSSSNTDGTSSKKHITQLSLSTNVASGTVSDLINSGKRFIGNSRYGFGAMNPAGHVFDCSGYVNWAYQQIGINLGARSTSGLQYVGVQVSASNMQPGDLVFFDTYKHNGHVAIYAGGGQFIGSQSSTGVAFASMNNSYWRSHFHGYVRRVLQ